MFVINRENLDRDFQNISNLKNYDFEKIIKISGIFGLIRIENNYYLSYFRKVIKVCEFYGSNIY